MDPLLQKIYTMTLAEIEAGKNRTLVDGGRTFSGKKLLRIY